MYGDLSGSKLSIMSIHTTDPNLYRHPSALMELAQEGLLDDKDLYRIAPRLPLDQLLERLNRPLTLETEPNGLAIQDLLVLSDLKNSDAKLVRDHWPAIPLDNRTSVVQQLVDYAQEHLEIHLGRLLRIALRDPDADIRRRAIEGLWEDDASDLVGPLVQRLLNDPASVVRQAAAKKLGTYILAGELDELESAYAVRAEEALLTILHNTDEEISVRCHALESIAYSGEVGIRQLIEDGYYSAHEEMRLGAMTAMGRSADIRWRNLVRVELQNPSPRMRAVAAQVCGELEARAAIEDIIELVDDEEQAVRFAAIFALGRLGGKDAHTVLTMLAQQEELDESEVAEAALEELLFYADGNAKISLFDESSVEEDEWDFGNLDLDQDYFNEPDFEDRPEDGPEDDPGDSNDEGIDGSDPWEQWLDGNEDLGFYEE